MFTRRLRMLSASSVFALVTLVAPAHAQPYGVGNMMGLGMMDRGALDRMCSPATVGFSEWRIARLEQMIKLSDAQRAEFDQLKTASNKAADIMRSACPTDFPRTALGRMEVMEKHADAALKAIKMIRPAMESFYATLSDAQKARLNSSTGRGRFWHWRYHW